MQFGKIETANEYNPIGEPIIKYLHGSESGGNFNQQIDYSYNTRGWLRSMNQPGNLGDDLFALNLNYEAPQESSLMASAAYNGNITEMLWHTFDQDPKGYGFTYDGLSRLLTSNYGEGASYSDSIGYYNTAYGYDANGNINKLGRYRANTQIDSLTYIYPAGSNQLQSVTDDTGLSEGYHASNSEGYGYDVNGNMEYDPSKQFGIGYNYLNLPKEVSNPTGNMIRYTYDASGSKLAKAVTGASPGSDKRTDYSGPFVYEGTSLKCIFTSAGRILTFEEDGGVLYKFEYNLSDHLGNTRVVFGGHSAGKTELIQHTDYYPFGMVMAQQEYIAYEEFPDNEVLVNKYLYNGKELQDDEIGGVKLDWYDYGARMYDAQLGRWHVMDPLAEDYNSLSPYGYVAGNPIGARDENGEWINFVVGAVIGAVVDAGLQAVEIALDDNKSASDFSWKSVGVSAASGAVGAGIISKMDKAIKVTKLAKTAIKVGAEVATDATASAANQLVTEGEVDIKDVAIDAAAGQLIGGPVGKIVKGNAQSSQAGKVLNRQADRAQRVASGEGTRPARTVAAEKASEKASSYGTGRATAAGTASSNAASTYVKRKEDENQE